MLRLRHFAFVIDETSDELNENDSQKLGTILFKALDGKDSFMTEIEE